MRRYTNPGPDLALWESRVSACTHLFFLRPCLRASAAALQFRPDRSSLHLGRESSQAFHSRPSSAPGTHEVFCGDRIALGRTPEVGHPGQGGRGKGGGMEIQEFHLVHDWNERWRGLIPTGVVNSTPRRILMVLQSRPFCLLASLLFWGGFFSASSCFAVGPALQSPSTGCRHVRFSPSRLQGR